MKDSKEYSPKITKLFRSLKRKYGSVEMPTYTDPVEAIVDALVFECMSPSAGARTVKRMKAHFVSLNDLRVSRKEEILDVFNDNSEGAEKNVAAITQVLNALFEKQNKVTLEALRHEGKRQARKEIEEIPGITSFAVSFCFLTALDGHAIPLNEVTLQYLRDNELVHPDATDHDIAGFLERQISASDAYTFYALVREEAGRATAVSKKAETKRAASVKKKTTTKKKTALPKTTKKKTTKAKETKKK